MVQVHLTAPQPDNGPLKPLRPYGPQQYSGTLQPLSTLDNLSPRQISNMSLESIQRALPKGWELKIIMVLYTFMTM